MDDKYYFLQMLDSHHENYKTENKNDINTLVDNINFYESFIQNFFSKTGEAEQIQRMYKGIKESLYAEKTINCIDVNESSHIYEEYMDGMTNFIHDISNISISEADNELQSFEEKFSHAKTKDSIFIESLYDGKLNQPEETILSEAVSNIEFLIDFIPHLKSIKNNCVSLNESFSGIIEERKNELINKSVEMLYESVGNYCYSTIKNIISTYYDIQDTLFGESTHSDKENSASGSKQFQLF